MLWLKLVHISCVFISFTGFIARSIWIVRNSRMMDKKWVKIFPHLIDTLLLLSAIVLLFQLQLSPLHHWLLAKIGALVIYIGLGVIAFKTSRSKRTRVIAWLMAVSVFLYIVSVALTKSAYGFFVNF